LEETVIVVLYFCTSKDFDCDILFSKVFGILNFYIPCQFTGIYKILVFVETLYKKSLSFLPLLAIRANMDLPKWCRDNLHVYGLLLVYNKFESQCSCSTNYKMYVVIDTRRVWPAVSMVCKVDPLVLIEQLWHTTAFLVLVFIGLH